MNIDTEKIGINVSSNATNCKIHNTTNNKFEKLQMKIFENNFAPKFEG